MNPYSSKNQDSKWLKDVDCNSKFYHIVVNWKRSKNIIRGVDVWVGWEAGRRGRWKEDLVEVKEEAQNFFKDRFDEEDRERPRLDGVNFKKNSSGHICNVDW